ncbi:MAG: hypothetical protein O9353_04335, partial [Bacteroidia bacterium]|nr:hypothetical protein [Bacteroidia bacterium]
MMFSQGKPQEYTVTNLQSLNTKQSEFCAFEFGNTLVYTGEKEPDLVEYSGNTGMAVLSAKVTGAG